MYIAGFIKSLFTPRKFPSALYFLANQIIVFFVFYGIGLTASADNPYVWGAIGLALNVAAMLAMLSPFGEAVVRYRENARPINKDAYRYAYSLFEDVCITARSVNRKLPKNINLYVMESNDINAAATGHHTVIVTSALLKLVDRGDVSPQQFKAVLAHELGHISHSDTCLTLGIVVSGGLLQLVLCFYVFIIRMIAMLFALILPILSTVFVIVFGRTVTFVFDCWNCLGILLTNATSRKDEFAADDFAGKCGYSDALCSFLQALDPSKQRGNFLSVLTETHPATVERVETLQKHYG
ncbi:MAG: M48 family metalloprotease [Corallococcus sp.]|nr:M48 family metalloprotease [Corallococcus sp.]MCM1359593.1 M48 family metalloprotease [Corallococcus sp.]MCM1395185.1 M48 family metalloprotease [Corallococcus sp.]